MPNTQITLPVDLTAMATAIQALQTQMTQQQAAMKAMQSALTAGAQEIAALTQAEAAEVVSAPVTSPVTSPVVPPAMPSSPLTAVPSLPFTPTINFTVYGKPYTLPVPWPTWTGALKTTAPSIKGKTWYVDGAAGSDSNDGAAITSAFKTIAKAVAAVGVSDTVIIKGGYYREGIQLQNAQSGTAAAPLTFGSYGDAPVVLDGSTPVTGWTQTAISGVWNAKATFKPICVVVNDIALRQTSGDVTTITADSGKWFVDATNTITADFGSIDPNTVELTIPNNNGAQGHVYWYNSVYVTFSGLTIRGCGSNGAWGYGGHILFEDCDCSFNGKAGINFFPISNVDCTGNSSIRCRVAYNSLLNFPRGNHQFAVDGGGWSGGLAFSGVPQAVARGNIVYQNGGEGIISYGTGGQVLAEQNVSFDNWSCNMYFDNQIGCIGRQNIIFYHNVDTSLWFEQPSVGYPWNTLYKMNTGFSMGDEFESGNPPGVAALANTQFTNNLLVNCRLGITNSVDGSATTGHGLKNALVANNTVVMPATDAINTYMSALFMPDNGANNVGSRIVNNIFYSYGSTPIGWSETANGAQPGVQLGNNLWFCVGSSDPFNVGFSSVAQDAFPAWAAALGETGSQYADPLFTGSFDGIDAFDYHTFALASDSPALKGAVSLPEFAVNLLGQARTTPSLGAI